MSQYDRDPDDIHLEICEEAVSLANQAANPILFANTILPRGTKDVFTIRKAGKHPRLSLKLPEGITDPDIVTQLHKIGVEQMKQALINRPDLSVGLILGYARRGENYFDTWDK